MGDGIAFQFPVCIVDVVIILKVLGLFHMLTFMNKEGKVGKDLNVQH